MAACENQIPVRILTFATIPRPGYPNWLSQVEGLQNEPCALRDGHAEPCVTAHRLAWATKYQHLH